MNCIVYTVSYNFAIHPTCPLTFMVYKYSELQVFDVIQNLSYKANCRTHIFFLVKLKKIKYMRLVVEEIAKTYSPTFAHKKGDGIPI